LEASRQAVPESDAEEVERRLKRSFIGIALQRPSPRSRCVVDADIFHYFIFHCLSGNSGVLRRSGSPICLLGPMGPMANLPDSG
jgi:hypothetical protein